MSNTKEIENCFRCARRFQAKEKKAVQSVYAKCLKIVNKHLKGNDTECFRNERLPLKRWINERAKLEVLSSFAHVSMSLIYVRDEIRQVAEKARG